MRFLHTRIRVRDLERSVAFYRLLGLEERNRHLSPRGNRLVFMHDPKTGVDIELCYMPNGGAFHLEEDIFHMAFEVEDLEEALRRLRQQGVKVTEEPTPSASGTLAFIEDPDGYEIELLCLRHA
jgi:lactoylglutathione lyase